MADQPISLEDAMSNMAKVAPKGAAADQKPISLEDAMKAHSELPPPKKTEEKKALPAISRGAIEDENKQIAAGQFTSPYWDSYSKENNLGEASIDDADRVSFKNEKGEWEQSDTKHHVGLKNPETGKLHVFKRSEDTDYGPIKGALMGIGQFFQRGLASTTPATAGTAPTSAAQRALMAAKTIEDNTGVAVPVSKAAVSENPISQLGAKAVSVVPGAGSAFERAAGATEHGLATAAEEVASTAGHTTNAAETGEVARQGLKNYVAPKREGGVLAQRVTDAYDKVDALVDPAATTPLNNTRKVAQDIVSEATARESPQPISTAVKEVLGAATNPKGLTYESLKSLRTRIGEMMESAGADTSKQELQRLYRSLSDDMRAHVQSTGGPRAVQVWERANRMASAAAERRNQLSTILGTDRKSDEATFGAILKAASTGGGANVRLLATARKALRPDEWGEVVGGAIRGLGRDTKGEFDAGKFIRDYAKMSDEGKNVLFGESSPMRKSLESISQVAETFPKINKLAGSSGETAHTGLIGLLLHDPVKALGTVLGGRALAGMFAREATAENVAKFMQSYKLLATKPTRANLVVFNNAANAWNKDAAEEDRQKISEITDVIAGSARKAIVGLSPFGK